MSKNIFYNSIQIEAPVPIDERLIVDVVADTDIPKTKSDLIGIKHKYPEMYVYVRATKSFYYLKSGATGLSPSDWVETGSNSKFTMWDSSQTYTRGSTVFLGTSGNLFYIATRDNTNSNPLTNTDDWLAVSSSSGGSVSIDYVIADNTVQNGSDDRKFQIAYSSLGSHPVVETWMYVYDSTADTVNRVPVEVAVELDRNIAGDRVSGQMVIEFIGKLDDIQSNDTEPTKILGKLTIR